MILSDVKDYSRGNFGNVFDMENPYLELLRVAENELAHWENESMDQVK